ncbi:hypothetical protein ACQVP2_35600 [Methylobacterium aquaticum]|uniref:hypothetical protein n=1 Tax=Methylobacterium aquaticum TaxID=270351 RepID=UPI003D16580D
MVAYNFQGRFVPAIRSGLKRHTIRAERGGRSRHARPGERVQLYQGLRTRHARLIAEPVCAEVWPVRLDLGGHVEIGIDPCLDLDAFAVADGFRDWVDLCAFWRRQHPGVVVFSGVMIRWAPIAADDFVPEGARRGGRGQMDLFGAEAAP